MIVMTMEKKAQKRILTKFIQTETNSFHSDKSTKINLNQDISYYIKPVERVDYNYDVRYSPMSRPKYHKIKIELG